MALDLVLVFSGIFHVIIVIFLTILLSVPFFADKTKRTLALGFFSAILSLIVGFIFDKLIPSSVSHLNQYLLPIIISLVIILIFLILEEEKSPSVNFFWNKFPESSSDGSQDKFFFSSNKQEDSLNNIIRILSKDYHFNAVDKNNNLYTRKDGLLVHLDVEDPEGFINLWIYYIAEPEIGAQSSQNSSISDLLYSLSHADLELVPQFYNPRLLRQKYQERILRYNIDELFKELPEDKTKDEWLSMLKERAALITLIKDPLVDLPASWLIIKFHHQVSYPPSYVHQSKILPTFLDECVTQFLARVNNIATLYLKNFIRLQASTSYAKTSLLFLHKYELPPLHHLVPPDEIYIDTVFQREAFKTEPIIMNQEDTPKEYLSD